MTVADQLRIAAQGGNRERELKIMLALAADHKTCSTERPRIEGDAIVIPFDALKDETWTIERETVRTRAELLDALGY